MEDKKIKDSNLAKVKILKCNKCNTIPYFKFYKEYEFDGKFRIFLKCKCNQIDTTDLDILNKYFIVIDRIQKKENKFKSNFLTDDVYKQILKGYKLAKEKIYVKYKEMRDAELKILYDRINKIENIYNEILKKNETILNIIQILIDTYENYIAENNKTFEILSQNIMNNTNFNLGVENIFNEKCCQEKIIYVNTYKYNLQHIKTISFPKLDYDNYYIELNLLSNKELLAFCKKKNENFENKMLYITLNDDFTIKSEKIIDGYFNYKHYFEIDKEKLFFYKDKDEISYILNIKTFEINKFYLNYNSFFNYINGNIIGFNPNIIAILNLKGEILLSKESNDKNYCYGLSLPNNNLLFTNSDSIFLFDEKLNEIKSKKIGNNDDINGINSYDKKILIIGSKTYILNLNLEIETIIHYWFYSSNRIYRFYINNYISIYGNYFIFIDNKKYMILKYDTPYLFNKYNNKIIFGRLRDEKNILYDSKIFYQSKKLYILNSNNLFIYQSPI